MVSRPAARGTWPSAAGATAPPSLRLVAGRRVSYDRSRGWGGAEAKEEL
jgi:hypothetical protein